MEILHITSFFLPLVRGETKNKHIKEYLEILWESKGPFFCSIGVGGTELSCSIYICVG